MNTNRNYDNEFIVIRTWMMTKLGLKGKTYLYMRSSIIFQPTKLWDKSIRLIDYISGITDIPISDVEKY